MEILLFIIDRILSLILWIGVFMLKHPILTLLAIIIFTIMEENSPSGASTSDTSQSNTYSNDANNNNFFYDWRGWTIYPGDGFYDAQGNYRMYGDAFYDGNGRLVLINEYFYDSEGISRIYSYN